MKVIINMGKYFNGSDFKMFDIMHSGFNFKYVWPWMIGMGILKIIVVGLVIYLVVKLIVNSINNDKNYSNNSYHHNGTNRALEILKERYANGEIGDEEYEQKKKKLME